MKFWEYTYLNPWVFGLFALIPLLVVLKLFFKSKKTPSLITTNLAHFEFKKDIWSSVIRNIPFFLRMLAFSLIIIVMARPQEKLDDDTIIEESIEGIDVMLSLDISQSMLAIDFKPNRLEASKKMAKEFIAKRPTDRIGLVVYEGESYTACALTTDHESLLKRFDNIKSGKILGGTAIGMGLATAINRLRDSKAKSKVIILLTDGENNGGKIHPITASDYAKEFGIRVYTIGVGKKGLVKIPSGKDMFGRTYYTYTEGKIDEKMLKEIAHNTGGKYYRAKNNRQLNKIYSEIDKLEKAKINVIKYKRDLPEAFYWFVISALILFGLEFLIRNFILRITT